MEKYLKDINFKNAEIYIDGKRKKWLNDKIIKLCPNNICYIMFYLKTYYWNKRL